MHCVLIKTPWYTAACPCARNNAQRAAHLRLIILENWDTARNRQGRRQIQIQMQRQGIIQIRHRVQDFSSCKLSHRQKKSRIPLLSFYHVLQCPMICTKHTDEAQVYCIGTKDQNNGQQSVALQIDLTQIFRIFSFVIIFIIFFIFISYFDILQMSWQQMRFPRWKNNPVRISGGQKSF